MTMDASAIEKIQETKTTESLIEAINGDAQVVATPAGFQLHSLEQFNAERFNYRGIFSTSSIQAFGDYCEKQEEQYANDENITCFVDPAKITAQTIFDIGNLDSPGHCRHRASLTLTQTADYKAILQLDGREIAQQPFAEFLQDWKDQISSYDETGETMDIKKAIASIRRVKIKATAEADHTQSDFSASSSRMASVSAESENGNVGGFLFTFKPYDDLDEVTFDIRLSLLTTRDKPVWIPRIRLLEKRQLEIAQDFRSKLNDALVATSIKTFLGSYETK